MAACFDLIGEIGGWREILEMDSPSPVCEYRPFDPELLRLAGFCLRPIVAVFWVVHQSRVETRATLTAVTRTSVRDVGEKVRTSRNRLGHRSAGRSIARLR